MQARFLGNGLKQAEVNIKIMYLKTLQTLNTLEQLVLELAVKNKSLRASMKFVCLVLFLMLFGFTENEAVPNGKRILKCYYVYYSV